MDAELHQLTLTQLAAGLGRGEFSAVELTRALLGRIERHDGDLNAFVTVTGNRRSRPHSGPTTPGRPATPAY